MNRDARVVGAILAASLFGLVVLLVVMAGGGAGSGTRGGSRSLPWEKRVARVDLVGDIYDPEPVVEEIRRWRDDESVRAMVIRIDSPGGTVAASQEIYEEIRRYRDSGRPVVASLGNVAASGAYYAALGATEVMASPGTLTGSIGVIMSLPNTQELFRKVGVEVQIVKSGSFKDIGNPFRPLSEPERAILQGLLDDAYGQFVGAVAEGRHLERDQVLALADGRLYSGQQAKALGLVDSLGTYHDAVLRAGELAGMAGEPRVVRQREPYHWMRELVRNLLGPGERAMAAISSGPRLEYRLVW